MRKYIVAVVCLLAVYYSQDRAAGAAVLPRKAGELQIQMPGMKKPVELSEYKGKPVVLAFILTTCSHCQYTTGLLVKLQTEFVGKVQVVECAVNDGAAEAVPDFVKRFKPNFPVGYNTDQTGIFNFLQHPMNATPLMPMLAFIDRHGVIRAQYQGVDAVLNDDAKQEGNLRAEIEKLIAIR